MTVPRAALFLVLAAATGCEPEKWTDPGPKLPAATLGAPHLELETQFVVGMGGGFALAFDASGAQMASGGAHGDIMLWDAKSMSVREHWHPYRNAVESLSFSPDGTLLVSGALRGGGESQAFVCVWDIARADLLLVAKFTGGTATAFAPSGEWFAFEQDKDVVLVDTKTLGEMHRFPAGGWIERIAVSRDSAKIAVGGSDGHVREFDVKGKILSDSLLDENEPVYGVGYLLDGTLAAASRNGTVRIGSVVTHVPASVGAFAVSWDGKQIAVGESSGFVHVLKPDGKPVDQGRYGTPGGYKEQAGWVGAIAFPPNRSDIVWLLNAGPLYRAEADMCLKLSANESEVKSVAFPKDGDVVASGGETVFYSTRHINLGGVVDRIRIEPLAGFVASGSDHHGLFSIDEDKVKLLDVGSHAVLNEIALDDADEMPAYGAWPSPDGRRVVVSRWRSTCIAGATGEAAKPFGESGRVFDGAWSVDGRTFFGALLTAGLCGNGPRVPNLVVIVTFDADGAVKATRPVVVDAQSLDLSPSGKLVALATSGDVQFRDAETGELVERIPVQTEWWRFLADDAALVGTKTGVALWKRGSAELVPLVEGPTSGSLSPSRDRVAFVAVGRVFVYRIVR